MSRPAFMNIKTTSGSVAATRMGRAIPVVAGAPVRTAFAVPLVPVVSTAPPTSLVITYTGTSGGGTLYNFTLTWVKPPGAVSVTWTLQYSSTSPSSGFISGTTGTTSSQSATTSDSNSYFFYRFSAYSTYADSSTSAVVYSSVWYA